MAKLAAASPETLPTVSGRFGGPVSTAILPYTDRLSIDLAFPFLFLESWLRNVKNQRMGQRAMNTEEHKFKYILHKSFLSSKSKRVNVEDIHSTYILGKTFFFSKIFLGDPP